MLIMNFLSFLWLQIKWARMDSKRRIPGRVRSGISKSDHKIAKELYGTHWNLHLYPV